MRGRKLVVRFTAGLGLAGALAVVVALSASSARSASGCTPSWSVVRSPIDPVQSIVSESPTDAWAVGGLGHPNPTAIAHWDGTQWTLSWWKTRSMPPIELEGIAVAGTSAWVVADTSNGAAILSWDGSAWSFDKVPTVPGGFLSGVVALATDDVWAVGERYSENKSAFWTLIEHWDGSSWKVVHSPKIGPTKLLSTPKGSHDHGKKMPASTGMLTAVSAVSPNNIWAVGTSARALKLSRGMRKRYGVLYRLGLLTEHWNGRKWSVGATFPIHGEPDPGAADGYANYPMFESLAAASSGDVLGIKFNQIVSHVAFPGPPVWWLRGSTWTSDDFWQQKKEFQVNGGTVISHNDAWVEGTPNPNDDREVVGNWDGKKWHLSALPARNEGGVNGQDTASGPDDVWLSGSLSPLTGERPNAVMLHYTC